MNPNKILNENHNYYSLERSWTSFFKLRSNSLILDVGCGAGELGKSLKAKYKSTVHGVEITDENFKLAKTVLDDVLLADFEQLEVNFGVKYDYIIFSDSIEHMIDTQKALRKAKNLLNGEGELLIAVPNIRNFRVLFPLVLRGEFEYKNEGILDQTHLRFFTKESIIGQIIKAGFQLEEVYYELPIKSKVGKLNLLTFGLFEGFLTSHFYIRASL